MKVVYLKIHPVRYQCNDCDNHPTTTETYDWCSKGSSITKGLEKYLMRNLIHSTVQDVSKKEKIGYKVLTSALNRKFALKNRSKLGSTKERGFFVVYM